MSDGVSGLSNYLVCVVVVAETRGRGRGSRRPCLRLLSPGLGFRCGDWRFTDPVLGRHHP